MTIQPFLKQPSELQPWDREAVLAWLVEQVPPARLHHILRVEEMACQLAEHHDLAVDQAAQAGLMHDLAKYFGPERLLQIATDQGWTLDPVELANPHLLHAPVSAVVAQQEFAVQDQAILDAIRHHTLGKPQMSSLSSVVFLADSLEPGRGDRPQLEEARHLAQTNLIDAVACVCDLTLKHLIKTHRLIHPQMVLTRNWAWQVKQSATLSM
ncbi:MAG: HD domain-containing protein [Acaryochloridaceae cyanobacterium SU_2_1]|nr:HD domain-containing protein [Acaryochloridaceae cyanobacterium SU_2_1]